MGEIIRQLCRFDWDAPFLIAEPENSDEAQKRAKMLRCSGTITGTTELRLNKRCVVYLTPEKEPTFYILP